MTESHEYPYALDIAAIFVAVQTGPVAPYAIGAAVIWAFARRSGLFLGMVLDLIAQLTGEAYIPDTPVVRKLLPGLERVPQVKPSRAALPVGAGQPAQTGDNPQTDIPSITLAQLATSRNILIVGSPGSGKTTLLRALIQRRSHPTFVFDPHAAPDDWNGAALVIGAGRNFAAVYQQLCNAEKRMDTRSKQRAQGVTEFPAVTLAGDEWGSICSEIETRKDTDAPGRILLRILKEGRKFGINAILSAHGDTAASVGSKGDTRAFKLSFDWIVYAGGYVGQYVGDVVRTFPHGKTPEGNSFPLIVVAVNPATNEQRLVDLRELSVSSSGRVAHQPGRTQADDTGMLEGLLGTERGANVYERVPEQDTACTRDVPERSTVQTTDERSESGTLGEMSTREIMAITSLLEGGATPSAVAKNYRKFCGMSYKADDYAEHKARVERVREYLRDMKDIPEDDGPEPDVGPFGRYL